MPTRNQIIAEARSWLGTRWQHQGRTRHGVDCIGLVLVVARTLRISDVEPPPYMRRPRTGQDFASGFYQYCEPVSVTQYLPGDILVFPDKGYMCHTGIATMQSVSGESWPAFVHAHATNRMVIESPLRGYTEKPRLAFRFPMLED